jgi:hypothetical protein
VGGSDDRPRIHRLLPVHGADCEVVVSDNLPADATPNYDPEVVSDDSDGDYREVLRERDGWEL